MKFDVVDTQNKKVGQIELDDSVFGAEVKPQLFYETVKSQLASRRRGTHSTKTVTNVSGTTKKPYKQKGTGQARHGSRVASNMRGGGVVFGPHPRDYSYRIPKKMVKGALRSALSLRTKEAKLHIVKGWTPGQAKTKEAKKVLANFAAEKALVVGSRDAVNLGLSLRNLPRAKFLPVEALNVYDVLNYDHIFIAEDVVKGIGERLHADASRKERERAAKASSKKKAKA